MSNAALQKISLSQAVVVEGKYDKIRLSSLIDAVIITTDGFGIFKDKQKTALLRTLAKKCGIVIFTDSDSAGFLIRSHLKNVISEGEIYNAYIPDILGKEKRKTKPSKEGNLGVEGMQTEILLKSLEKAGVLGQISGRQNEKKITSADLYQWGLFGGENSRQRRITLQKRLDLPEKLNKNSLLEILNRLYSYQQVENIVLNGFQ